MDNAICSSSASLQEKNNLKQELNSAYLEEEVFWKQKSRIQWLRSGDKNTKYFHGITKARRNRNTIHSISDENGVLQRGTQQIAQVAQDYFQKLYSSVPIAASRFEEVFSGFERRVTDAMKMDLIKPVTAEEIETAIFDIGAHRAPGPDGFSAIFYHQYWEDIKPEIIVEVTKFFETGMMDEKLNHTHLCLIPKVYPPTGMQEF